MPLAHIARFPTTCGTCMRCYNWNSSKFLREKGVVAHLQNQRIVLYIQSKKVGTILCSLYNLCMQNGICSAKKQAVSCHPLIAEDPGSNPNGACDTCARSRSGIRFSPSASVFSSVNIIPPMSDTPSSIPIFIFKARLQQDKRTKPGNLPINSGKHHQRKVPSSLDFKRLFNVRFDF
jgi:hypothetical protein